MADLFETAPKAETPSASRPLADRLRPVSLSEVIGQDALLGPDGPLGAMLAAGNLSSLILWGPPGVGKTTIARLLADEIDMAFVQISAIFTGVADLKKVFEGAKIRRQNGQGTLLFVDEIHRFNKAQQDGFLPHMEDGTILLRLVLGLVGAIIMYLILKAEMIGGTLFPEWEKFQFVDAPTELLSGGAEKVPGTVGGDLGLSADGSIQPPEAQSTAQTITPFQPAASGKEPIRLISKDFAQLLVCSLLAGFSERLIPDRFRSIEETAFAPTSALK